MQRRVVKKLSIMNHLKTGKPSKKSRNSVEGKRDRARGTGRGPVSFRRRESGFVDEGSQ
jgi:hypothetical protein